MSERKINVNVTITDNKGKAQKYRLRPIPANQLTPGVTRCFRVARDPEPREGNREIVYYVGELAEGFVQCSCEGFKGHQHCKHRDGLVAFGFFQPELAQRVIALEDQLAATTRELEELRQGPPEHSFPPGFTQEATKRLEEELEEILGQNFKEGDRVNYVDPKTNQPTTCEVVKVNKTRARVKLPDGRIANVKFANLANF